MLSRIRRWSILSVLGLFFFMVIVDGSIVAIAIPKVAQSLSISTGATTLIISIYLITICATLLLFGQFGDQYGRIKIFKIGTFVFLLGSFLAGAGQMLNLVLLGRLIQGIGASMTMANSYAIVTDIFPSKELGRAFGIESIFISLGALAGPGLGGLILAQLPWGYIFWINLPIGLICLVVELAIFPKDESKVKQKIDWYGALTLMLAAISLYLVTATLSSNIPLTILFLGGFLAFGWWFIKIEQKVDPPLLNLAIFRTQLFTKRIITAFLTFIVSYFFMILAPLYLQLALNYSVQFSGILLMVAPITSIIVSPIAGYISDHYDQRVEMTVGLVILIVSQFVLILLSGKFEPMFFISVSVIMAIGTAVFGTPNSVIVMQSVPKELRGMAGSTNSLMREFGLVLGTTISTALFYQIMSLMSHKEVHTASGASKRVLLISQRWTYGVAFLILLLAIFYLIVMIRKGGTHEER
ncbi:MFS transporter [Secundilactobacillus malefermentans]|uniref:Major facilitator superfamily (MFS) profile domain-containing protein n=1 Tax=Secundilactobacillus malefermentans TaxID=176292 RepID=A0A4R5NDQ9_9LACO|nr:MFS transporter [Secundilactobacillus malefermentans]QEA31793.1 MFS transporter [Secundilactobacillus malefermentans]TDG70841.1 hypothetical protein C5L31_000409 [Secundilactobacillus malefermentans]